MPKDYIKMRLLSLKYCNIFNCRINSRDNEETIYTANNLNQYSQRTVADLIDVLGSAETNTTVTINDLATTRHGKYWHKGLGVTNDSASVYQPVNVVGVYNPPGTNDPDIVTTETGHVFVAQSPEAFTYDDDGNLLSDGRFNYTWDGENRLVAAETLSTLPSAVPRVKVEFAYDYMSRRVGKSVYNWISNDWALVETRANLFNGWDLIREKVIATQTTTNWYLHGLDLSGSLAGAGGIGGLLAAQLGTNSVVYSYDANGNVSELINSAGTVAAHYEYSPYGQVIVATGPMAEENETQFSTKPFERNIRKVLYEYRIYEPENGRWLSRDLIAEYGGINIYQYCFNMPIFKVDVLGLAVCDDLRNQMNTLADIWTKNYLSAVVTCGGNSEGAHPQESIGTGIEYAGIIQGGLESANYLHSFSEAPSLGYNEIYALLEGGHGSRGPVFGPETINVAGKVVGGISVAYDSAMIGIDISEGNYFDAMSHAASIGLEGIAMYGGPVGTIGATAASLMLLVQDNTQKWILDQQKNRYNREQCDRARSLMQDSKNRFNEVNDAYSKNCNCRE